MTALEVYQKKMKLAVAVVLFIAFLATFAMATLTFEEAQARLAQIQELKQMLSEEESALQSQGLFSTTIYYEPCLIIYSDD